MSYPILLKPDAPNRFVFKNRRHQACCFGAKNRDFQLWFDDDKIFVSWGQNLEIVRI